jgi:hypothetical protein
MYAPIQKIRKQNHFKVLGSNLTRGPIQDSPNQPNSPMCLREKIRKYFILSDRYITLQNENNHFNLNSNVFTEYYYLIWDCTGFFQFLNYYTQKDNIFVLQRTFNYGFVFGILATSINLIFIIETHVLMYNLHVDCHQ